MVKRQFNLAFVFSVLLALNACSFKKDSGKDKGHEAIPTGKVAPQNIFEALKAEDQQVFLNYLSVASAAETNSYDVGGLTPLYIAVRLNNYVFTEALLKKGAIVLKPNRQTTTSSLSLAEKSSESIAQLLSKNIDYQKRLIVNRINEGHFDQAFTMFQTQCISPNENLQAELSFVDIILLKASQNPPAAEAVLISSVPATDLKSEAAERLWSFAFSRQSLALVNSLVSKWTESAPFAIQLVSLEKLMFGADMDWNLSVLKTLNSSNLFMNLNMADYQSKYFDKLFSDSAANLNVEIVKSDLKTLAANSIEKTLCDQCILRLLNEKKSFSVRVDLIEATLEGSLKIDEQLLANLVSKVSAADIRIIASALNSQQIESQKNAVKELFASQQPIEVLQTSYSVLKEYGISLSPAESRELMSLLIDEQVNGVPNARAKLALIENDILARKVDSKYSPRELQMMASSLVRSLSDANVIDAIKSIQLLFKINGTPFTGVTFKSNNGSVPLAIDVDFEFWILMIENKSVSELSIKTLDLLNTELRSVFKQNGSAIRYSENKVEILFSFYEMIVYSALEESIIAQIGSSTLANLIRALHPVLIEKFKEDVAGAFTLSKAYRKTLPKESFLKIDRDVLNILFSLKPSDSMNKITGGILQEIATNFGEFDALTISVFERYLPKNKILDENQISVLKNYIKQQNPRLYVALMTNKESYKRYMLGFLAEDPLCQLSEANTSVLQHLYKNEISSAQLKEISVVCKTNGITHPPTVIKFSRRGGPWVPNDIATNKYIEAAVGNEKIWVDALVTLKERLGDEGFDKADIFGLTAADLPFKVYKPKYEDFKMPIEKNQLSNGR